MKFNKALSFTLLFILLLFFTDTTISFGQSVTNGGALNTPRQNHCSEVLANGMVLGFGGDNDRAIGVQVFASAELYDPATSTWSNTGAMNTARTDFSSVILNNGNVLSIGGWNYQDSYKSCEIYNVATKTWTYTGDMTRERIYLASIKLRDGRVLVVGGGGDKTAELYDAVTGTWTLTGETNVIHGLYMDIAMMDDGKILAIGGDEAPNSAEIYDPATEQWTLLTATTVFNRASHKIIRLNDGKYLIVGTGGFSTEEQLSAEIYDPVFNTFTKTGDLLTNVSKASALLMSDGFVLLYNSGDFFTPQNFKCIQIYNPYAKIWTSFNYNFLGAYSATVNKLNDGKILLSGGSWSLGNGASSQCYIYSQNVYANCVPPNLALEVVGTTGCSNGLSVTMPIAQQGSVFGTPITYEAYIGNTPAGYAYSAPYIPPTPAITLSIPENMVTTGMNLIKIKVSKEGCPSYFLTDTAIVIVKLPSSVKPTVTINGSPSFCYGETRTLTVAEGTQYAWSNGMQMNFIVVNTSGSYKVKVKDAFGCFSQYSDPIVITVAPQNIIAGSGQNTCYKAAKFNLQGASPAGGTWSGVGVTAQGVFDPAVSGLGTFVLTYSICNKTATRTIEVLGPPIVPDYNLISSTPAVCYGNASYGSTTLQIENPNPYISSYEFWRGNTLLKSVWPFYVQTVTVRTPLGVLDTLYKVLAINHNICGVDTLIKEIIIKQHINPALTVGVKKPKLCRNDSTYIYIVKSEPAVSYQLVFNYNVIGNAYQGNGDTLFIPTGKLINSKKYAVYAIKPNYCSLQLTQTVSIHVSGPNSFFTVKSQNLELGEDAQILNNSINSNLFKWAFGTGAQISSSTLANPPVIKYSTTGSRLIQLVSIDINGCMDTLNRRVNIIAPVTNAECNYSVSSDISEPVALIFDDEDNMFQVFDQMPPTLFNYSPRGDSLFINWNWNDRPTSSDNFIHPIVKYNAKGIIQWSTYIYHRNVWAHSNAVAMDHEGSVYFSFYYMHTRDSVYARSTDGTVKAYSPPYIFNENAENIIVVKYNKDGLLQWINSYPEIYTASEICLVIDKDLNLFSSGGGYQTCKFDKNGNRIWLHEVAYSDLEIDSKNNIWGIKTEELVLDKFDTNGNILFSTTAPVKTVSNTYIYPHHLELDEYDNLYVGGEFYGGFIFNKDTLFDPYYYGDAHTGTFFCKINANGKHEWIRTIKVGLSTPLKGMDYKSGKLLFTGRSNPTTLNFNFNKVDSVYQNQITFTKSGSFIGITDTSAQALLIIKKIQDNNNWSMNYKTDLIAFSKKSSKIIFTDQYTGIPILGQSFAIQNFPPINSSIFQSSILFMGTLNCIFPEISPIADFTLLEKKCTGTKVRFTDLSSDQPVSWQWTFAGGTPATSTQRNPIVTFNTSGKHLVTLISKNQFGTGTAFSQEITIDAPPTIQITPTETCINMSVVLTASGAKTYAWTPLDNSHVFYLGNISKDTIISISATSEAGCTIKTTQPIRVIPAPVIQLASINDICKNATPIDLPAATPSGGVFSGTSVSNGKFNPALASLGSNTISYTYRDNIGCAGIATATIIVNPVPIVQFLSSYWSVCQSSSQASTLSNVSPVGGTFAGSFVNNGVFTPAALQPGDYYVTYTYTDNKGCTTTSFKDFTIRPLPVIQFTSGINNVCVKQTFQGQIATPYGGTFSGTAAPFGVFDPSSLTPGFYTLSYSFTEDNFGCNATATENVTIASCTTTPVNELNTQSSIIYYPNPCNGSFVISNLPPQNDSYKILIYNASGQLVKQMETASGGALTIDIKGVAAGLYHFKILNTDTTVFENNILVQ